MFVRGQGTELWDAEGAATSTSSCGLAVTSLGHAHPEVAEALAAQAATLLHVSNLFATRVATDDGDRHRRLLRRRRAGVLLQLRRRGQRGRLQAGPQVRRPRAVTWSSPPTAASTAGPSPRSPPPASRPSTSRSSPMPEGFRHVRLATSTRSTRPSTRASPPSCSSPSRARAGSIPAPPEYLEGIRRAVRRARAAADRRRGADRPRPHRSLVRLRALRRRPDVVCLAKALGNGMPIGACWARREVAAVLPARRPRLDLQRHRRSPPRRPGRPSPSCGASTRRRWPGWPGRGCSGCCSRRPA